MPFKLLPDQRRLLKDDATISLRPRAFDLLVALVDRAGHLVTKAALLDQVWSKTVVEEAALHVQVSALRKVSLRHRWRQMWRRKKPNLWLPHNSRGASRR